MLRMASSKLELTHTLQTNCEKCDRAAGAVISDICISDINV